MKKMCLFLTLALMLSLLTTFPATAEKTNPLNVPDEGYRIDGDGWYCVNTWCKNGEDDLFGRMYYPEDFDATQTYTTVVLVHGMTLNCDFWHKCYAPALAQAGYICYAFDERSGTEYGRGSFSTPTESGTSGVTETVSDASAALDFVETLDYVDKDSIFLFGNSKGSMSVQVLASQRSAEIAGVIALYGNIAGMGSDFIPTIDEVLAHPYDNGEVLVIWGSGDTGYDLGTTLENMALYPETSLVLISDAYHGFGNQVNRPAVICAQEAVDYIDRIVNGIPNEKKKASSATADDLKTKDEGYTYAGEGYTCEVQWAHEGDVDIFGRMYYPADFDETKQYPVIVASHGGGGTADVWDKTIAPRIVQMGECLVYAIDAQSETDGGRGSYSTPLEGVAIGANTVENYADDIEIAIDHVKALGYVDAVYLMGGSKGGVATQLAASRRSEDVAGIIIQSGGLGDDNGSMVADYATLKNNPYSGGEVLFVQGVNDDQCLIARGEANMSWYPLNTFVAISSTGHGFGYQNDRSTEVFVDSVNEFIHRTYNHIGE